MKILVFGSNGLVGNSLKRILTEDKFYSKVFFSKRSDTNLFSYNETEKILLDYQPDLLINAAAKVGGINANNSQRTSFLIENMKINLNILEASTKLQNIKIINLGSSCIYPLNAENPIPESSFMSGKLEPTNSPYAMAKLTAIELGNAINSEYGFSVVNLMPTNLYGPNDNFSPEFSHVIPGLLARMNKAVENNKKEFSIWGTGKPKREFLYVDDLALAIKFIIKNNINDELLNIGSGEEVSILELAEIIKNIVGFEGKITFNKNMPDGNPRKLLDSSKINNYGWSPKISLKDGLIKTYNWYKKLIN